jgi:hypothetical protein
MLGSLLPGTLAENRLDNFWAHSKGEVSTSQRQLPLSVAVLFQGFRVFQVRFLSAYK